VRNIDVAEATDNLLCQDTGIPIYNLHVGPGVLFDGQAVLAAIRRGCERATREYPLRSSVVHPLTRRNEHSSCGIGVPVVHVDFDAPAGQVQIEMVPKGSGSENNSFLKMAVPAEGVDAIKTFVIDCVLAAGGKTCPPTIVGVGWAARLTGVALAKWRRRARGQPLVPTPTARRWKPSCRSPSTSWAWPTGPAVTPLPLPCTSNWRHAHHMNPIAVNMQCHSARRARATFTPEGVTYGF
jgi:fumarate hydratase subunit alpha/L(+)-tartrate dehydratase alpha subunit